MTFVLGAASALVVVAAAGAVLLIRRSTVVVSVTGHSMVPTLADGDRVVVRRIRRGLPAVGDVVVVGEPGPCRPGRKDPPPHARWLVKRVAAVPGDPGPAFLPDWARPADGIVPPDRLVLLGDNASLSRDSRQFGPVPVDRLLGVVLRRLGGGELAAAPEGIPGPAGSDVSTGPRT